MMGPANKDRMDSAIDTVQSMEQQIELENGLKRAKLAIRKDENDPKAYLHAGKILVQLKRPEKAIALYKRALTIINKERLGYAKILERLIALEGSKCQDAFLTFPLEILLMILSYLSFRQIVRCTRVSKTWRSTIISLPDLWTVLNVQETRRNVSNKFISRCINSSRYRISAAYLPMSHIEMTAFEALVTRCNDIQMLWLSGSQLNGRKKELEYLGQLTRLQQLTIRDTAMDIVEIGLLLQTCPQLLTFHCNKVVGISRIPPVTPVIRQNQLKYLRLEAASQWTREVPNRLLEESCAQLSLVLGDLQYLSTLELIDFPYLPSTFKFLVEMGFPYLETLNISGTRCDLSRLPSSLKSFECSGKCWLRIETDENVPDDLPSLNLKRIRAPYETLLELVICSRNKVNFLDFGITDAMSLDDLKSLEVALFTDKLKELYLFSPRAMDDELIPFINATWPELKVLTLVQADITGYGVKLLIKNLKQLKILQLKHCEQVSSDAIEYARRAGIEVEYDALTENWNGLRNFYAN